MHTGTPSADVYQEKRMNENLEEAAQKILDDLTSHAEFRSKVLTGYGPTKSASQVRDLHADALVELARIVLEITKRTR